MSNSKEIRQKTFEFDVPVGKSPVGTTKKRFLRDAELARQERIRKVRAAEATLAGLQSQLSLHGVDDSSYEVKFEFGGGKDELVGPQEREEKYFEAAGELMRGGVSAIEAAMNITGIRDKKDPKVGTLANKIAEYY